jgi:hypothetical protein
MASTGFEPHTIVWNFAEGKAIKNIRHTYPGTDVCWFPDSKRFAIS